MPKKSEDDDENEDDENEDDEDSGREERAEKKLPPEASAVKILNAIRMICFLFENCLVIVFLLQKRKGNYY